MKDHNKKGNCWENAYKCKECGKGDLCDVCHDHDSPRGECKECPQCEKCVQENESVISSVAAIQKEVDDSGNKYIPTE